MNRRIRVFVFAAAVCGWARSVPAFCPGCGPVLTATLAEQFAQSDIVVLTQFVGATKPSKSGEKARTLFKIVEAGKGKAQELAAGRVELPRFVEGNAGDLFLLFAVRIDGKLDWSPPLEVTETSYQYIRQAPHPELPGPKRLAYYLKFFEFPDSQIANDAYAEFAKAPYEYVKAVRAKFSRERVRKWLGDSQTPPTRIGLYGLMLGLCGTKDDVAFLEKKIVEFTREARLGIDGVIAGYLMLTGEKGLDLIDRTKLSNPKAPRGETYSALLALRITWTYGDGAISRERLRKSLRLLIDDPTWAELIVPDLARWKDWSVQDRLVGRYDDKRFTSNTFKEAVILYLTAATKDKPKAAPGAPPPVHVIKARRHLQALEKRDPKAFRRAML